MKFKNTFILFAVFVVLLAVVLLFDSKGRKKAAEKEKEEKLVDLAAADVRKMTLTNDSGVLSFMKDDKGPWRITEPFETGADETEVDNLAESFAVLKIERVVEAEPKDLKTYEIPKKELSLWVKGKDQPTKILIGMENPLDKTLFAKREDEKRVVLLASSLKTSLEKKLMDFRQKDVFRFESSQVKGIRLRANEATWAASKKNDLWEIEGAFRVLANTGKIETFLDLLSGLKAKEFVSENKTADEIKKNGLDKPEYEVVLSFPTPNKEAVITFHKDGESLYAADSLSNKIILVDSTILSDLEKKVEEYKEKKAAVFYSWDVDRISVSKNGFTLAAYKDKTKNKEKWHLETPDKAEADGSRIETFIRKIEGLEAVEFIAPPKTMTEFGLDKPEAEIKVRVPAGEKTSKEIILLVGREDKETKQLVVKNAGLDYLFKVDSSFLQDFPHEAKDWKAVAIKER